MRVGDFSACVVVDGSPLEEYDVVVDEAKLNATCWIPSQSGKNFIVQWTCLLRERPYDSAGFVSVDENRCRGTMMSPERGDTVKRSRIDLDSETVRDFMFSDVKSTGALSLNFSQTTRDIGMPLKLRNSARSPSKSIEVKLALRGSSKFHLMAQETSTSFMSKRRNLLYIVLVLQRRGNARNRRMVV